MIFGRPPAARQVTAERKTAFKRKKKKKNKPIKSVS
jgi:hypothetical protein